MTAKRLLSLDVFRGITVALMIVVNSPGNETVFPCLAHSVWHGCTLADLVFPFFIFIVGMSASISITNAQNKNISNCNIIYHILKRSLLLFFIGLFLNAFPYHFDVSTLRFYGVLQRIAICYCITSLLYLVTSFRTQFAILLFLLLSYWLLLTKISLFTLTNFDLTPTGNVAAYIDRLFFSPAHLYLRTSDPEGLLSTIPSIATALLGNLTGRHILSAQSLQRKYKIMLCYGALITLLGWLWGYQFPINKSLWSSSYVLWTGGLALIVFAICYWIIEIKGWKKWAIGFDILGLHSLLVYFLHVFFLKIQAIIHISQNDGTTTNLKGYITDCLFHWASFESASLLYATTYTLFWLGVLYQLQKRKIIK